MMRSPWQIWSTFVICGITVVIAMSWLTAKALELDHAQTQARINLEDARRIAEVGKAESELQELVDKALWRMDWTLMPLVAQEAARPYYVYQPFYPMERPRTGPVDPREMASPLLLASSDYVILHFEVNETNLWTSPQNPTGSFREPAMICGVEQKQLDFCQIRLGDLRSCTSFDSLLASVPEKTLPAVTPFRSPWDNDLSLNFDTKNQVKPSSTVANDRQQTQQVQQLEVPPQAAGQQSGLQLSQVPPAQMRGQTEWVARNKGFQSYAQSVYIQKRANSPAKIFEEVEEGVSRSIWLDDKLLLARRVRRNEAMVVQGCWLNWPKIKTALLDEVQELLPGAELYPVVDHTDVKPGRSLATLPVHLVVPEPEVVVQPSSARDSWSLLRVSLLIAWVCMTFATAAIAMMLQGVMKLSERRAAFVSAVTHELRTPLTTFRMYAEMLAEDMVPDEKKRREYLDTLKLESDRLSHLVENVLQYAQLERGQGGQKTEDISIQQLNAHCQRRLEDRAAQSRMQLCTTMDDATRDLSIHTNPGAVEQILLNLIDNACKYANSTDDQRIHVHWSASEREVTVQVADHGPGIPADQKRRLFRPFSKSVHEAATSAPGVGLGLSLCSRLAHQLGGSLAYHNVPEFGATFELSLPIGQ